MLSGSKMQIGHSCHLLLITNQSHLLRTDLMFLQKPGDMQASLIRRGIIDDNDMIVLVILIQNALEIELISEVSDVVVGRDYDAERQFLWVVAELVDTFETDFLLFVVFLELLALMGRCEGKVDVAFQELPVALHRLGLEVRVMLQGVHLLVFLLPDLVLQDVLEILDRGLLLVDEVLKPSYPLIEGQLLSLIRLSVELAMQGIHVLDCLQFLTQPFEICLTDTKHLLVVALVLLLQLMMLLQQSL